MGLRDVNLKAVYYSDEDNLLTDFYIPVLANSVKYDRIAGYFSSNSLAIAAKGIADFLAHGGKMRLITNVVLSIDDQEAIKQVIERKQADVLTEIENLEDELKKDHVRMLAWMLGQELLEMKIAVVDTGIEHQKIGIMQDSDGNELVFSGSDNETVKGWLYNDEQFHVFCNWVKGDDKHLLPDIERFKTLWNDEGKRVRTYSVSDAFKNGLIETAPKDTQEFTMLSEHATEALLREQEIIYSTYTKRKKVKLRDYQKAAIQKWRNNSYRCLFEMATGTGKTFAALGCLALLDAEKKKLITVIACPYNHMVTQWKEEIHKYGIDSKTVISDSSRASWRDQLADCISAINTDVISRLIVLTTHDTFYRDLQEIVEKAKCDLFLIADEVHGMWSEQRKSGFSKRYRFRLGLSATPSRWFDSEGTVELFDYFGVEDENSKFVFTLEEAINTVNPETGQTYLVTYEYKPYFVELTDDELGEYEEKTKDIVKAYHKAKGSKDENTYLTILCNKREDIIRNAHNKYTAFREILEDIGEIRHCLIYCSPEQIAPVQNILISKNIVQHKFTQEESTKPDSKYGGISERDYLLNCFSEGTYQSLVAMRCLDEGVDIPQARIGIILASTGNPRQYIQRRGRLLRRHPGKKAAKIYDIIVLPPIKSGLSSELIQIEKKIVRKELKRYEEFAGIASNAIACIRKIEEAEDRLGL